MSDDRWVVALELVALWLAISGAPKMNAAASAVEITAFTIDFPLRRGAEI